MPNAWSNYLFPLAICILFIIAGIAQFRRFAHGNYDARGRKYGPGTGCMGVLFAFIGGVLGLTMILTSPTPWARQRASDHVFRTPPDRIKRFVIKAGNASQYKPLTNSDVTIDDPDRIRQIANMLRDGIEVSPNHPQSKWTTQIEMVTSDGTFYFGVDATVPGDVNDTLVSVSSKPTGGGWHFGDVQVDGLDKVLENALEAAKPAKPGAATTSP
jgi:hypothetical protein